MPPRPVVQPRTGAVFYFILPEYKKSDICHLVNKRQGGIMGDEAKDWFEKDNRRNSHEKEDRPLF
jgi:hypothetical protein